MVDFNITDVLRRFNQQNVNTRIDIQKPAVANDGQGGNNAQSLVQQLQSNLIKNMQQQILLPQNVRMNNLASVDRSVYIKKLLKLPDNMSDLLIAYGNNKTDGKQVNENLNQNQQVLQNNKGQIQQNLQQLQNFVQNQARLNQPQQMLSQQQQPVVQQPVPQQQVINVQPQVQPPLTPPNERNNDGQKVQQDNQQGKNHQQGKHEQGEIQKQPKLPQQPSESFAKTMQGVNNAVNRPIPQPQVQQQVPQQQAPVQNHPQVQQQVPQQQAPVQNQPQVQQQLPQQQAPVQNQPQVQQQVLQQQAPVQNQPQVQQQVPQPQAPVQNQPQAQQQVSQQQAPVQNQPQVQQQQAQVQQPVQPNLKNKPLPPQNIPNHVIQNTVPNQINRPVHNNIVRPNVPTGGAAMIQDEPAPAQMQQTQYTPQNQPMTPASIYNRMHAQMLHNARFEPMANLRDSVRMHIRQPLNMPPKPPVEQVQEEVSQELRQIQQQEMAQLAMKEVSAKVLPSRVNLSLINSQIQQHSKQALNSLILEMSTATRQGITDTKPLQDTIGLINASISASSQDDTATAIKNLMLLYLPWLPLEEGVGFKLDVETKNSNSSDNDDTSISIMVTTKNYGNISAEINLITTNSVDIFITCDKTFPKEELLKRLKTDSKEHSMTASIGVEEVAQKTTLSPDIQKAKVNLSNVTTINPYLLLMSHSFIRHAIELDINTTMYGKPVQD